MKNKKGCIPLRALGKRIIVRFHDHSIYDVTPIECEITGFVDKLDEREVIVRWWSTFDGDSEIANMDDNNNETARVIQGTVVKWALCEPRKWNEVE